MEGIHDILLGDKPVGRAEVIREGLYYRFLCRCRLAEKSVCRISAGGEVLGVLIPEGEEFHLETRLPAKRFLGRTPIFRIQPNRPLVAGRFEPISPEEPFAYIERLKHSYLVRRGDQVGIIIGKEAGT